MRVEPGASRRLSVAAWLALGVHLIAGLAMLVILKRGLETNLDLADRMAFVASSAAWKAAWFTWTAASASILYFMLRFAQALPLPSARLALALTLVAVPLDLAAQWMEAFVLPSSDSPEDFLRTHRLAVLLTGFGANSLYTLGAGAAAFAGRRRYPAWITGSAAGVVAAGAALSLAAALDSMRGMFFANAALVPFILAWQGGIAVSECRGAAHDASPPLPWWKKLLGLK